MNIYIIGSTGFIGQNLVNRYSKEIVFKHTRNTNLLATLELFKPDLIINCAAEIYESADMYKVNVEMVKVCLDWCKNHLDTQFIQLGSSSEYGSVSRPSKETDPIVVDNMYSGTKGAATLLCQAYAKQHKVNVQIIRPYSPYGPGERPHRLFPALWRSFKLNETMNLAMGVHDFCYIDDFIDAVDLVVKYKENQHGRIINVSSGVQISNSTVLEVFRNITGADGNVKLTAKFTTPPVWVADITVIKNMYGWQPKYSLEQGIRKFLNDANYE